jgi:hypothetical protein
MNSRAHNSLRFALLALSLAMLPGVASAATNTAPGRTNAPGGGTNAPAEVPIPVSTFAMPGGGNKDPFYPKSGRIESINVAPTPKKGPTVAPAVATLKLGGVSGTKERPFAVINGLTFSPGEEKTVLTASGKVNVLCIEVRPEEKVAIVEISGQRKELRMSTKN